VEAFVRLVEQGKLIAVSTGQKGAHDSYSRILTLFAGSGGTERDAADATETREGKGPEAAPMAGGREGQALGIVEIDPEFRSTIEAFAAEIERRATTEEGEGGGGLPVSHPMAWGPIDRRISTQQLRDEMWFHSVEPQEDTKIRRATSDGSTSSLSSGGSAGGRRATAPPGYSMLEAR